MNSIEISVLFNLPSLYVAITRSLKSKLYAFINKTLKSNYHTGKYAGLAIVAIMNGGAIPENALFTVIAEPTAMTVGTLDEDFAVESNRGDVILLGSTSWSIRRIESGTGRVIVEDAHGAPPSVPFWIGEAPARTDELSLHVARLRQTVSDKLLVPYSPTESLTHHPEAQETIKWLEQECHVNEYGAQQFIDYILQGRSLLGAIPSQQTIIAERFFDESGGMQLVIHSPFGARINKAWGLALRKCFAVLLILNYKLLLLIMV